MLRVLDPGLVTTVQDRGRPGYQRVGIPPAGALDTEALALANALAGAPADAAALECRFLGPTLEAEGAAVRVALAGATARGTVTRTDGTSAPFEGWRSLILAPGDRLGLGALGPSATAYLAVSGGLALAPVMGSRSTLMRARLGGIDGRALRVGDRLAAGALPDPADRAERGLEPPRGWLSDAPIRVVLGPQDDHFTPEAVAAFLGSVWRISGKADRMGLRLEGPTLQHHTAPGRGADIVSDGIVTGAVQVPGSGQPILLLADRQTSGGYAKIAAAISADLPRLGRLGPGRTLRFEAVDTGTAAALAAEARAHLQALIGAIAPVRDGLDLDALYRENLISGIADPGD
ncbi:MAG: biotin-dependent carboxyltransferase family protein [Pseudomonadota bacterium]